jgi:hypothetical protein
MGKQGQTIPLKNVFNSNTFETALCIGYGKYTNANLEFKTLIVLAYLHIYLFFFTRSIRHVCICKT